MTLRAEHLGKEDSPPAITTAKGYTNNSLNLKNNESAKMVLDTSFSFKTLPHEMKNIPSAKARAYPASDTSRLLKANCVAEPAMWTSQRSAMELDAAAVKLQKVYKSYRTRRHLADCAVVVEELWWKALDFAALKVSSVSFFENPEAAVSRWSRARTRAAKVGKGLSKDENAQKLALRHWLEAIDPRHRYGHNLHLYFEVWFNSESIQPFFYWLDIGNGKEVNLEKCPRTKLQRQCIKYLGPKERESFEVLIQNGKLMYKQSGVFVNSDETSKWIFVLSTTRNLYVGQKQKGQFQHSSFLAGGAITAAGRLVVHNGVLEAIWPYSGHYLPTEEHFNEFLSFLKEHSVDLATIKTYAPDEENPPISSDAEAITDTESIPHQTQQPEHADKEAPANEPEIQSMHQDEKSVFHLSKRMSRKWSTGAGPRIGCVREYPAELQFRALEQVQLSPRAHRGPLSYYGPIPSPRPSPGFDFLQALHVWDSPAPEPHITKGKFF